MKKISKKKGSLINEIRIFLNGYFFFNNIDDFQDRFMVSNWILILT